MCSDTVVGKWPIGGNGYEQIENILSALPPWFIEEDFSCSDEDLTILLSIHEKKHLKVQELQEGNQMI